MILVAMLALAGALPSEIGPSLLVHAQPISLPSEFGAPEKRTVFGIYSDSHFRFAVSGGGRSGKGPPALVVCDVRTNECREVTAVSTKRAVLGCYPCDRPLFAPGTPIISVTWDFRPYRSKPYLPMPLRTTGSFVFPDKIEYDKATHVYRLLCNPSLPAPYTTTLQVRAADLEHVFSAGGAR